MKRIVVTGGAGFLGSHLCEALLLRGDAVICIDNLSTSEFRNVQHLLEVKNFAFINSDVSLGITINDGVDCVVHLASPASPPEYLKLALETLAVGSRGTEHCLKLSKEKNARFIMASTSEIYGDPLVHPQPESYWGNVSSVGPRSVYDEAKRFAEALTVAYSTYEGVDAGIIRIFNTYGPRLRRGDGRVVSNFISQAIESQDLTIYGDGLQTRSFWFVSDLIVGIIKMIDNVGFLGPVNLGNPEEIMIKDLAEIILNMTSSRSKIKYKESPVHDPIRRRPNIDLAFKELNWSPVVSLNSGLSQTIEWFSM